MGGMGPWADDPPIRVQACPVCGGKVDIAVVSAVRIGDQPEHWSESGRCRRCSTDLVRSLGDTERPVVFMTRSDWRPSSRQPPDDRPRTTLERSGLGRTKGPAVPKGPDGARSQRLLLAVRLAAGMLGWGLSVLATHFMLDVRPWRTSMLIGLIPFVLVVAFAQPKSDDDD